MLRKRLLWIIVLVLVLAAGGGGYYYYRTVQAQAQAAATQPAVATATVEQGDLVITASGSGTLVPAKEVALGFESGGMLAEILVKVGDKVEAGQVLARLDDTDAQAEVSQAQISLRQAEISLADLTQEADTADLAAAQASLSSAKASLASLTDPASSQEVLAARETLKSAKEALATLLAGPSEDEVISAKADLKLAEADVWTAQAAYDKIAWQADVGTSDEAIALQEATINYDKAKATYNEAVQGATQEEIASARATVAQAQADLDDLLAGPDADELAAAQAEVEQAQAELDALLAGASATDLETAQLDVSQAQLDLDSAKHQLEYTELVAPIAGTVLAIDAEVGESVSTDAIITLADMEDARMEFWVEEADLASVAPGNAVNIVFEALPDYTYPGQVISIDPELVEVDSTPAIQAYASVDLSAHPITLLSGMNGDVEVVAGEARNALLVPVEALREIASGQYAVFVVKSDGQLEMRTVEVGLKDYVDAQILSGLEQGEVVSLGTESNSASSTEPSGSDTGAPPMMPMMPGG